MRFFYEDKSRTFSAGRGGRLDFGPHLHGHVEIVGMLSGCTCGFIESKKYDITPGDIFIVFPNQIHYYESRMDEQYMILLFPPDMADEFSHIFNDKIPKSPLVKGGLKDELLLEAMKAMTRQRTEDGNIFREMEQKGYFFLILGRLLEKLKLQAATPGELATVNLILNYCMSHYSERLLLEDVANALHINKYYISHLFSQKMGMGFGDYVRSLRVSQACRLLEKRSMSITEVAYSVGFSSSRTFNRAFIKYVGLTPRDYQKKQFQEGDMYPAFQAYDRP